MTRRGWLALILLAVVVRVGYHAAVAGEGGAVTTLGTHLIGDERAYDAFAREVAAGAVERERAFYQEPLYAWLVGQVYRVWPPPPRDADLSLVVPAGVHQALFVVQHLLGLAVVVLTALLGLRAAGPRVGLLAGLFAAVSGPLVFHEAMLLKATLGLAVFTATLHLWIDQLEGERRGWRQLLLGLCLGLGVLLRGNMYLLVGLVVLATLAPLRRPTRQVGAAALVLLGVALAVAPVTWQNLRRGELVLTTYQSGTNAAIGQPDSDDPGRGVVYEPLRAARGDALYEEADAVALAEQGAGRPLTGREVSAWWWSQVAERVGRRPGVAVVRTLYKLVHLFHGREVPDVKDWSFFSRAMPWFATPLSHFALLGPWALVGFFVLPWRRRPGLLAVRGGLLTVALALALFYVMGRYRLSAAPCLWVLAAGAVDMGLRRWREGGAGRRLAVLTLALGPPLVLALVPLPSDPRGPQTWATTTRALGDALTFTARDEGHQTSWSNAATIERQLSELESQATPARVRRERAVSWARRAIEQAPLYGAPRVTLVRALSLSTPLLEPRHEEAQDAAWRLLLVMEGERTGEDVLSLVDEPLPTVRRAALALVTRPSRPGGEDRAGPVLAYAGRCVAQYLREPEALPVALFLVDRSLRLEPEETLALVQRGLVLKRMGRLAEAEAAYRRAVEADVEGVELFNNLGNVLIALGRPGEAVPFLERALELSPDDALVLANLRRARGQ